MAWFDEERRPGVVRGDRSGITARGGLTGGL